MKNNMAGSDKLLLRAMMFLVVLLLLASLVLGEPEPELKPRDTRVYMVIVKGSPAVHYNGGIPGFPATAATEEKKKINAFSDSVRNYASYLVSSHDELLATVLRSSSYNKLYSYHHLINGFAVELTEEQAGLLRRSPGVLHVEEDQKVEKMTTHTPEYIGLPDKCWPKLGGVENAGQGVVIGIVDTGIDPTHPSFADQSHSPPPSSFTGRCEIADNFPKGSCTGKIIGARHFAQAAIASGEFNASLHFASPLDGDGHGSHTAATAAGNNGIPVMVNGFNFGSSSGMAPRAHIAVYKALYAYIGGFFADVVAAIDQAVEDGVDVLSLSVGPSGLPRKNLTFMSTFDLALLSAVKAGVFVTQAVGNGGPLPRSSLSFSPWIFSVAASTHDRSYSNSITLGSNITITGTGLAGGTTGFFNLITSGDAYIGNRSRDEQWDECQEANLYKQSLVKGKIIICDYSVRYLFGVSTVSDAVATAKSLGAEGVVFLATPDLDGHAFAQFPVEFPGILIPRSKDTSLILQYYNSTKPASGVTASISGGMEASFSFSAPRVATYSSRGPDVNSNSMDVADVLKPNVLAPGHQIWASWSELGIDERDFVGQKFAMISGTSMATPHVAGIAALVKQKFPKMSPAGIASAIAATALTSDTNGDPLLAQHPSENVDTVLGAASPFDLGSGFVNPAGAIDPGLIFDAGYDDYVGFLCSLPTLSNSSVVAATGSKCGGRSDNSNESTIGFASDLNTPYVSIASLNGQRGVVRRVTSVGVADEVYKVRVLAPTGVAVELQSPDQFGVKTGESVAVRMVLRANVSSNTPTFGQILLEGDRGHRLHIPICVSSKSLSM